MAARKRHSVGFSKDTVKQVAAVAPKIQFSKFVHTAVDEKIQRDELILAPLKRLSKGDSQ